MEKLSLNSKLVLSKISNLEKLLNSLGDRDKDPNVKFTETSNRKSRQETKSSQEFNKSLDSYYRNNSNEVS